MRELKFRLHAEKGYFEKFDLLEDNDDTFHDFCWLDSHTDADIEQYTGVKDKNGKPIYEGDILDVKGCRAEVVFDKGIFCVILDGARWVVEDRYEIVGNIHENEELLHEA